MQCPYCGKEIEENASSCPSCGKSFDVNSLISDLLSDSRKSQTVKMTPEEMETIRQAQPPKAETYRGKEKKKKSKAPIAAAVISLFFAAIVLALFLLPKFSGENKASKDMKVQTAPSEPVQTENESDVTDTQPEQQKPEETKPEEQQTQPEPETATEDTRPEETQPDPEPEPEPELDSEPEPENSQYVMADSDSRYYSYNELYDYTQRELMLARNEIYARHGWIFGDDDLRAYFEGCDWYEGTVNSYNFNASVLNEYEIHNKDLILEFERDRGWR